MLILAQEIPNPRLLVTVLMSLIGYLSRPDEPILPQVAQAHYESPEQHYPT